MRTLAWTPGLLSVKRKKKKKKAGKGNPVLGELVQSAAAGLRGEQAFVESIKSSTAWVQLSCWFSLPAPLCPCVWNFLSFHERQKASWRQGGGHHSKQGEKQAFCAGRSL